MFQIIVVKKQIHSHENFHFYIIPGYMIPTICWQFLNCISPNILLCDKSLHIHASTFRWHILCHLFSFRSIFHLVHIRRSLLFTPYSLNEYLVLSCAECVCACMRACVLFFHLLIFVFIFIVLSLLLEALMTFQVFVRVELEDTQINQINNVGCIRCL